MQRTSKLLIAVAVLAACGSAQAAANLTSGGYAENFDSMGTTGKTMPAGWAAYSISGDHYLWTNLTGMLATQVSGGTSQSITSALLDNAIASGTKNAAPYNLAHAATSADRVLSTIPTGTAGNVLELTLTNTTGASVNAIKIGYDIVKFTDGTKQSSIDSKYVVGEELPGYELFYSVNGGAWTNVSALNPVATPDGIHPVVATGTPSAAGAAPTPDYAVTSISNYTLSFASALANGQTLKLRWVDDNAINISGDQAIGLNNVSIAAVPEPETYAMLLAGLGLLGFAARRRG